MNLARITRNVAAVALALWCAGPGCVLVSYAQAVLKSHGGNVLTEATQTPHDIANLHGSCHARAQVVQGAAPAANAGEQLILTSPGQSDAMSCPLANGSIVTTSRLQISHDQTFAAATEAPSYHSSSAWRSAAVAIPLRLPNQHHLYLRGGVFLI